MKEGKISNKKIRRFFRKSTLRLDKKQLKILFYLASRESWELVTQIEMSEELREPLTTLNYHFTKLREEGLIDKQNRLTDKGSKLLQHLVKWDKTFDKKLRVHNIQLVFNLLKTPNNFFNVKNTILIPFTNKRYRGLKAEILGCKVLFYSKKKAVVTLQDVYANNDEEIASAICDVAPQLIQALEMEFPGLKIDSYKPAKFKSMHVAVLDSVIAEQSILKNGRCYSNGRNAVDKSNGRYELEAEDHNTALEDIEILVKYEDLARENEQLKEQIKAIQSQLENIRNKKINHNKEEENDRK